MKKLLLLFSVAVLFAMVASAGTVTFATTPGSTLCLVAGCSGTSVTFAGGTIVSYIPAATQSVNPDIFMPPGTTANIGSIQVQCTAGTATSCGDSIAGLILTIFITQTNPSNGTGTIGSNPITGSIGYNSGNAQITWSLLSTKIGLVNYSISNSPLNLVPVTTNNGITSIQAFITDTPEPSSILLLSSGLVGLLVARSRRR